MILIAEEGERALAEQYFTGQDILVTGVGALNILRSLRGLPLDTPLINIGYVGSANYRIGAMVEVGEVRLCHPNVTYKEPSYHLRGGLAEEYHIPVEHKDVPIFTSVDFVLQSKEHDCVFDMELAFIVGMGFTDVRALKIVSDNLSLHEYHDLTNGVE
jgi:hypothetical protein